MTRPKIVVAPSAFKGTLSPRQAAAAMARGIRSALPEAEVIEIPVADGGDGTLDVLLDAIGARAPGYVGEICCGRGEAIRLINRHFNGTLEGGMGIDISPAMIQAAAADVTDEAAVRAAIEACVARFGRLDILHNNVGISIEGGDAPIT